MDMLGMYPTFYVPWIGTAWVMGIIGVIHVVASHTWVGAFFSNVLARVDAEFYEPAEFLRSFAWLHQE